MNILETPRLVLRHLEMRDLDDLFALYRDPEMRQYYPDGTLNYDQTKEELEWFLNGHPHHPELGLWATVLKANQRFVGRCGLLPWTLDGQFEVEVAYMIDKAYWGQGLGSEAAQAIADYAFHTLNRSRLICLIEEGNTASMAVARKIGMTFERTGSDEYGPYLLYSRHK